MDSRPFRYRHDVALIRQRRWYLEAIVFSSAILIVARAVRGMLESSWAALVAAALELVVITAVVLAGTAAVHAWRGRRISNGVRSP